MPNKAKPSDQRGQLESKLFSYQVSKGGMVFFEHHGRTVKTLRGNVALQALAKLEVVDGLETQLVLAKLTGNFKRGNERGS